MRRLKLTIMILFVSVVYSGQVNNITEYKEVNSQILLTELWINEVMNYYKIPGIAVGIIYDQELVYSNGFGVSDLEDNKTVNDETIFRIASISKLFTGTAIMQLRDDGRLKLDDPVKKYIDWFEIKNSFKNAQEVTIRQILTHTSGLPREAAFPYWSDFNFPTAKKIKETLPDQNMIFEPETKWKYSNLGIALLGEVVESASGMDYEKYINEKILLPLKMYDTKVSIRENDPDLATGYLHEYRNGKRVVAPFTDSKGITAAANFSTTIKDLAKFCSLQFNYDGRAEDQIIKGSTLREMHRPNWIRTGWKSAWGLAFSTFKDEEQLYVGHAGWISGFRSQLLFNTKDKIGVIVFINTEDYSPYKIANRIYKLVAAPLKKALAPKTEEYSFDPEWKKYVGKYVDPTFWYSDVIILNDKLYLYDYSYPPTDNPSDNLTLLYHVEGNTFRMKEGNGELVTFEMNDSGNVNRIKRDENFTYPIEKTDIN